MSDELSVSYQFTKQDIINFVLDSYSFEKVRCTLFLILNISTFVIGTIFLFVHQIPLGVFFITFSLIVFPLNLYLTYITAKNSLKSLTSMVCTLKDDGISFISNFGDNTIPYKDLSNVIVTEELIFVYIDKNSALIVPKRAFKSTDKAITFAAALMDRFNKAKQG